MKIVFENHSPEESVSAIKKNLEGRNLGNIVDFELDEDSLFVVITKIGTSRLKFNVAQSDSHTTFDLDSEKIAFSHRAFKHSVIEKLCKVIDKSSGKVVRKYGD